MKITIDSNSLTYLIQSMEPGYDPLTDDDLSNRQNKLSMLRIFLYQGEPFYILPQVIQESNDITKNDITKNEWKNIHESTTGALLFERSIENQKREIDQRREEFLKYHNKYKDCQLLSESECLKMEVLLTGDKKFKNHLSEKSTVKIMYPSEYWESLKIESGVSPKLTPSESNPLSGKTWWKI